MRPLAIIPFLLILVSLTVDLASAQIPARVAPPYTLMDDETRTYIEGGVEVPLKGNGPTTGYAYLFSTRPHFLAEDLYLRLVVPPGYLISELILDHFPSQNSALGVGVSGGFFAESQTEFRDGRYRVRGVVHRRFGRGHARLLSAGSETLWPPADRGPDSRQPKYVWYERNDGTSRYFRLPENTAIYDMRVGVRLGGVPPGASPHAAMEASVWHTFSYRDTAGHYGFAQELQESDHYTQRTWTRLGATYTFGVQQVERVLQRGHCRERRRAVHVPHGRGPPPARRVSPCCCTASMSRRSSRDASG